MLGWWRWWDGRWAGWGSRGSAHRSYASCEARVYVTGMVLGVRSRGGGRAHNANVKRTAICVTTRRASPPALGRAPSRRHAIMPAVTSATYRSVRPTCTGVSLLLYSDVHIRLYIFLRNASLLIKFVASYNYWQKYTIYFLHIVGMNLWNRASSSNKKYRN